MIRSDQSVSIKGKQHRARLLKCFERFGIENTPIESSGIAAGKKSPDSDAYEKEIYRIRQEAEKLRNGKQFIPAIYLHNSKPDAHEVQRLLRCTSKSFELNLRFKEIEKLDYLYRKVCSLLDEDPSRSNITVAQYEEIMKKLNKWAREIHGDEQPGSVLCSREGSSVTEYGDKDKADKKGNNEAQESDDGIVVAPCCLRSPRVERGGSPKPSGGGASVTSSVGRRSPTPVSNLLTPSHEASVPDTPFYNSEALGQVLFVCSTHPPKLNMQLFLNCHRTLFAGANSTNTSSFLNSSRTVEPGSCSGTVSVAELHQNFARQLSLVKSEVELTMWDTNNDGRLMEESIENYVKDLVPRIPALRGITEDVLPFYCCTVSRRIFWLLDPGSRGFIRIDAFLQSPVMEEWIRLQLMPEDSPGNWFGAGVTQQLYEKFLLLDTRNLGTLNAENMKRYKKGLPTVIDDGLPRDVSPLCSLFIDRFFETNVMMTSSEMDFRKFVDFVIAVEFLPQCARPQLFWNIFDLEGKGVITPMIVNYFFRETHAKVVSAGLTVASKEIVVQEVFDLINPSKPLLITREEYLASPQAGQFAALIIDCLSFWTYENREPR